MKKAFKKKKKAFSITFKELPLDQIKVSFLEGENLTSAIFDLKNLIA